MDAGTARRENVYSKLNSVAGGQALPTSSTGNSTVPTPTTQSRALVKNSGSAWNKLLGSAEARLGSASDWQLNQNIRNNRTTQELGRISQAAKGDLNNVVPNQLTSASHAGDALAGWGTLLSAAGMLTGVAGAMNPGSAAASGGGIPGAPSAGSAFANPELVAAGWGTGGSTPWMSALPTTFQ